MTRIRAGLGVVIVVVALLLPGSAQAEPNPYGRRGTATTITLDRNGGYQVTLRESQTLVREYQITFGGNVHDGFRLPDDGSLLPPYLRASYTLTSATWEDGQAAPAAFTQTFHRWSAVSTGTYAAGDHSAELRYRVTGAARPTPRGWAVHVRLMGVRYVAGDTVTIEKARPPRQGWSCAASLMPRTASAAGSATARRCATRSHTTGRPMSRPSS